MSKIKSLLAQRAIMNNADREWAEEQIKALLLELVGSDQPTRNLGGNFPGAAECNRLRQELRDKINQL